jgi:homoserine kinase type II
MRAEMGTFRTLSADDVREIVAAFGLSGYRTHTPISAGTINTNLAVELTEGRRFLRVNEGKALDDVVREANIVDFAAAAGVPTPAPLRTADGKPYLHWRGVYVSLFPWLAGRTLGRADVGPAHARQVGAALARLHLVGAQFPDRRPGRYEPDEIGRRFESVRAGDDHALVEALETLGPALEDLARTRRGDLPLGLIHGDLFIDNVLFAEDGRLAALLDFEQASWGRLAYDVAVSVLAFGFGRDDFRTDVTRAFIEGYTAVRSPTAGEKEGFGAELRFAACRFAVTRITDVYLRRSEGAPAGKSFRRYVDRLRAVESHLARGDGLLGL